MYFDFMREHLDTKGYVVVRNLLTPDEVQYYTEKLENLSGISRKDRSMVSKGIGLGKRGLSKSWSLTDGVTKSPDFWQLIIHKRLVSIVRTLLGSDIRFLQHTDLHVGFSAISWHRDNVNRSFGVGSDWDDSDADYRIVRSGIYLQSYEESQFKLGFIPGSHRQQEVVSFKRKLSEANLKWMGALSYMFTNLQMWAADAEWVATQPGDCIIFDPRTIHSGSAIVGPKYSMFLAYGIENKHFYNHQNYYRFVRDELNYQAPDPELVRILWENSLFQLETPLYDDIEGAWKPVSLMKNMVSRNVL